GTSTTFDAERNAWLASCESLASKASAAGALKGSRTETRDVRPLQTSYKGRFEQSGPISCGWPILRNNTPTRAGCTSPSSLTLSRGVSSAGPWVSARWLNSTPRLPLEKPYVKLGL